MTENILIISGEKSGDIHGSRLVKAMLNKNPELRFCGVGGENMKNAGVELIYDIMDLSIVGLVEIIKHLPFLFKVKSRLIDEINKRNIKKVILVDYPGFNLRFASIIKKLPVKIFYYISPQIWAWGTGRIEKIRKLIDKTLVIFPFEEKLFRDNGIDAEFVGHPVLEAINEHSYQSKDEFFAVNSLEPDKKLIVIFPGSREQEIELLLPVAYKAADMLKRKYDMQIAVAGINSFSKEFYSSKAGSTEVKVIFDRNYELMKYGNFGIIKSGTSTLEAALMGLPMTIIYKTSLLSYFIGKRLVKINLFTLPNIVAGEEIVRELIQDEATAENIYNEIESLIVDAEKKDKMKKNFSEIKERLGKTGASRKAAEIILNHNQ